MEYEWLWGCILPNFLRRIQWWCRLLMNGAGTSQNWTHLVYLWRFDTSCYTWVEIALVHLGGLRVGSLNPPSEFCIKNHVYLCQKNCQKNYKYSLYLCANSHEYSNNYKMTLMVPTYIPIHLNGEALSLLCFLSAFVHLLSSKPIMTQHWLTYYFVMTTINIFTHSIHSIHNVLSSLCS